MKSELSEKDGVTIMCDFSARAFLKHKLKMTANCCDFKFLVRDVDAKHLMRFQSENFVFIFDIFMRRPGLQM